MANRSKLHDMLKNMLGSNNVYYQPPATIKMEYPAIVYSKNDIDSKFANNKQYISKNKYEIIVIDKKPDNPIISLLLKLPLCNYNNHYISDNLNHDVITLYY